MNKVVIDSAIPFTETILDPYATVIRLEGKKISRIDVSDADALIVRTRTKCDATLLEGSKVKFIGSATIGYDHIDLDYCKTRGIKVVTAAGCNAMAVVHYMAAVLNDLGGDLTNKKLGVIGVGNVGSRVAMLGEILGMEVALNDPPRQDKDSSFISQDLDKMLSECDIITIHTPYTTTGKYPTYNLAGEHFFDKMKHGSIFINASRGEVVDEDALIDAIDNFKISHAVIDVWKGEPSINHELLKRATIATPHIAGYSLQGKANGTSAIVRAFAEYFDFKELKGWYPKAVIPCKDKYLTGDEILEEIKNCYKIREDDSRLRHNPELFEELRNNYNYREEYFTLRNTK
ncbi:MAG: 4-phosphoerythronate dehydrogenase [Rikenellaceae bacterium]